MQKKEPKIRFKGFSGEWEENTFKNIFKYERPDNYIVKCDRYNESAKTPVLTANKGFLLGYTNETNRYCNISIIFDDFTLDNKYVDFPYMVKSSAIKILTLRNEYENSLRFAFERLNVTNIEILGHARHYISVVQPTKTFTPLLQEQEKIGAFFQNIDTLITAQEQKYQKLLSMKKALLEKMFPKDGAQEPKIRFLGFSGKWEEYTLSNLGKATGGTSIESEFTPYGYYKVISIGSYSETSTYVEQGLRAPSTPKTKERILNKNDLTMILNDKTASGRIIGRVLLIPQDNTFVYNQRTERIEIYKENFDPLFLYHMLNAPLLREKIIKQSQGNTQIYVNWSTIKDTLYLLPEKTEQNKIGELFRLLDKRIALQQEKIEKLKNMKRAFLEKMFV